MTENDKELSTMVQELWDNDVNRLIPGKDYRISLQVRHTQLLHMTRRVVPEWVNETHMRSSDLGSWAYDSSLTFCNAGQDFQIQNELIQL